MIVLPSARGRRFLVRLAKGETLHDALRALAREGDVTCAHVTASGSVVRAELVPPHGEPLRVGPAAVVSLTAVLARRDGLAVVTAHAALVPSGETVVLAGTLAEATADSLGLLVEALDDVPLELDADGDWHVADAPVVAPVSAREASWAAAAAQAAQRERTAAPPRRIEPAHVPEPLPEKRREPMAPILPDEVDEPVPEQGSWVRHKQFGLCHVEGEDADGALMIRLPSGVRKSLNLDYLRVLPAETGEGRVVYPLEPRKR